jgi:hypothetical protein
MKLLRIVLRALLAQDAIGVIVGLWFGSLVTATLFGIAAVAAGTTLALAEWFVAETEAYGRAHGLTTRREPTGAAND